MVNMRSVVDLTERMVVWLGFLRGLGRGDRGSTQRFHCLPTPLGGNNKHNRLKRVFTCANALWAIADYEIFFLWMTSVTTLRV
jgi:hypothetical protein